MNFARIGCLNHLLRGRALASELLRLIGDHVSISTVLSFNSRRSTEMIDTKLPAPAAGFIRVGMLQAAAQGDVKGASLMASQFDDSTPGVGRILRSAITSGS